MTLRRGLPLACILCLVCAGLLAQETPPEARLSITESGGNYVVMVPISKLVMTIPRAELGAVRGPDSEANGPRYFLLQTKEHDLVVSGWFEAASHFSSVKEVWAGDTAAWKRKNLPEPRDVSFEKLGGWDGVVYDVALPGTGNAHIRAHWVQAGTWIDIHLSLTANLPPAELRSKLREVLGTIRVTEKGTAE